MWYSNALQRNICIRVAPISKEYCMHNSTSMLLWQNCLICVNVIDLWPGSSRHLKIAELFAAGKLVPFVSLFHTTGGCAIAGTAYEIITIILNIGCLSKAQYRV